MSSNITSVKNVQYYTQKTSPEVIVKSDFKSKNSYTDKIILSGISRSGVGSSDISFKSNSTYSAQRVQERGINYFYSESNDNFEVTVSYQFEIGNEGNTLPEGKYQFRLTFTGNNISSYKEEKNIEKEDIVSFIQRIINEVTQVTKDKNKLLKGIIFTSDELQALNSVGSSKAKKIIQHLISMILSKIKLEEVQKKKNSHEQVILRPELKKYEKTTTTIHTSNEVKYEAELKLLE